MFTRRQPVIEMLDRGAIALRNGTMALLGIRDYGASVQRRPRRALSLAGLLMVIAGLILLMTGWRYTSFLLINLSSLLSGTFRSYGTLVDRSSQRDEREKTLAATSHLAGFGVAHALGALAFFYLAFSVPSPELANLSFAQSLGFSAPWYPRSPLEWITLALALQAIETSIALVWANWSVPRDRGTWDIE